MFVGVGACVSGCVCGCPRMRARIRVSVSHFHRHCITCGGFPWQTHLIAVADVGEEGHDKETWPPLLMTAVKLVQVSHCLGCQFAHRQAQAGFGHQLAVVHPEWFQKLAEGKSAVWAAITAAQQEATATCQQEQRHSSIAAVKRRWCQCSH